MLDNWLLHIPESLRNMMVNIIAGHEYIDEQDIQLFISQFSERYKSDNFQPVLIKNLTDQNGTHRILSRDTKNICRDLDVFSPSNIDSSSQGITFFADISISGSQIVKALKYYFGDEKLKDKTVRKNHYFMFDDKQKARLKNIFKQRITVSFYFALYTAQAKKKITEYLKAKFSNIDLQFEGREITNSCFLEDTLLIDSDDKKEIFSFLNDKIALNSLINGSLSLTETQVGFLDDKLNSKEKINRINFVARFQSMPKGSLDFLTSEIQFKGEKSELFKIVQEHEGC
jgi:hypothetical protein